MGPEQHRTGVVFGQQLQAHELAHDGVRSAPNSPGRLQAPASSRMRRMYSRVNRLRSPLASTSSSGVEAERNRIGGDEPRRSLGHDNSPNCRLPQTRRGRLSHDRKQRGVGG